MNCKPNQLAYVSDPNALAYGHYLTCLQAHPAGFDGWDPKEGPVWLVDKPLPMRSYWAGGYITYTYPDEALRPIKNPGDDAVDEMVQKVGPAPVVKKQGEVMA